MNKEELIKIIEQVYKEVAYLHADDYKRDYSKDASDYAKRYVFKYEDENIKKELIDARIEFLKYMK